MAVIIIIEPNIFLSTGVGIFFKSLAPKKLPKTPPNATIMAISNSIVLFLIYIMVLMMDKGNIMEIAVA